ncbi:hypothetical protein F5887DRAFT_648761 [Amanita rubescens]|nr:hypothetical protein F5887DRAFT_648761 [Amanita rubescens]
MPFAQTSLNCSVSQIFRPDQVARHERWCSPILVFVTGTGSLACVYRLLPNNDSPIPVPVDRSGVLGYLLCDEASGYHIGKSAVQKALRARDLGLPSPFTSATANMNQKSKIASLYTIVLKLAFPGAGSQAELDVEALAIVQESAASAVD